MSLKESHLGLPFAMLAELTHRCPLQCPYCSNPVKLERSEFELSTEEWMDVFEQASQMGVLQVHFSGGEPALRKDLEDLVTSVTQLNMYSNLITSGIKLDHKRLKNLATLGLSHVQISIQDSDEEQANKIGGYPNAYKQKILAARAVREVGLSLTINAPIHRMNIAHIESIIQLAEDLDAARLELAHIQYYGWAYINRQFLLPTFNQLKKATAAVENARKNLKGHMAIDYVVPDYYAKKPKSCMNGWGQQFLNVTPSGKVLPCHAAESVTDLEFQNVKEHNLIDIWRYSSAFEKYRGSDWMPDMCRECDRKEIDWGGCRCQAFAITGNASNADPACERSPYHEYLINIAEIDSSCTDYDFQYRRMN